MVFRAKETPHKDPAVIRAHAVADGLKPASSNEKTNNSTYLIMVAKLTYFGEVNGRGRSDLPSGKCCERTQQQYLFISAGAPGPLKTIIRANLVINGLGHWHFLFILPKILLN